MTDTVETSTRSAQTALEIEAPVEAVWRALTEAPEIVRWFALEAEVEPGEGGAMTWRWADAYRWSTRIEIWEPLRRLQLSYSQSKIGDHTKLDMPGEVGAYPLVVDFQLKSRAGGTWLRCVHSGFGRDAVWDDELEGVRKGWLAELESLRHYLEHHAGEERRAWWAFLASGLPGVEAWRGMVPRLGDRQGMIQTAPDGSLRLDVPGLETPLIPVRLDPPGDVTVRIPAWNDALLRIWCDPQAEGSMVSLFVSFYGGPTDAEQPAAKAALLARLRESLGARDAEVTVLEA